MADENDEQQYEGVLSQHRRRKVEDPAYRASHLTPPGNHPPGGYVDEPQMTAQGDPVEDLPSE